MGKVWLKDFWYKVEYNGLHIIWSFIKGMQNLKKKYMETNESDTKVPNSPLGQVGDSSTTKLNVMIIADNISNNYGNGGHTITKINHNKKLHGDWFIVQWKKTEQS